MALRSSLSPGATMAHYSFVVRQPDPGYNREMNPDRALGYSLAWYHYCSGVSTALGHQENLRCVSRSKTTVWSSSYHEKGASTQISAAIDSQNHTWFLVASQALITHFSRWQHRPHISACFLPLLQSHFSPQYTNFSAPYFFPFSTTNLSF